MKPRLALLAVLAFGLAAGAHGQGRQTACLRVYNTLAAENPDIGIPFDTTGQAAAIGCQILAQGVQTLASERRLFGTPDVDARDVQATRGATTPGPGEPVPDVEPLEAAGGSASAVGTNAGAGAVAVLTINPSILFVPSQDVAAVARYSRLADLTVLVPAAAVDEGSDAAIDYVGVRARINMTGMDQGSTLYRSVVQAYQRVLDSTGVEVADLIGLFEQAPALEACARVLVATRTLDAGTQASIEGACGRSPLPAPDSVYAALGAALRQARIAADSRYFGMDLRGDFGDLSLAGFDTTDGTSLFGGVAAGRRFLFRQNAAAGIRARLGARYVDPHSGAGARFALEGGVGFEFIRYYDFQRISLVAGLDFVLGPEAPPDTAAAAPDLRHLSFSAALNVPVTPTTSVTLSLGTPVGNDGGGPILSIKANWRLLWSEAF